MGCKCSCLEKKRKDKNKVFQEPDETPDATEAVNHETQSDGIQGTIQEEDIETHRQADEDKSLV